MTIEIWKSYSCNNSSSYRLVAKFSDAADVEAIASELREFFTVHATEIDERGDYEDTPSETQRAIGARYGFEWGESLYWGDDGLVGDEPDVFVHDNVLIVQHTYCGGLGDLHLFVKARGAESVGHDDDRVVPVSLLFRAAPGGNAELDRKLAELCASIDGTKDVQAPWAEEVTYGNASWFRDTGTVGLHLQVDPRDLEALSAWLAEHGIEAPSIEIDEPANYRTYQAIAKARCTACSGPVDYLDPRLHDIEAPQLVCRPCGGLYELSTFLSK